MMQNGSRSTPEVSIQLPETKVGAESGPLSGPLVPLKQPDEKVSHRKSGAVHAALRLLCLASSITAMSVMTTAKQASSISLYGFTIPLYSKWSFSDSFEYLVGASAAVAAHSLLQLLINLRRMWQKPASIPSRSQAWLTFAGDQIFAYGMMSAGSAASGVTNLNRTGIHHSALPNFCKPLQIFCDHVTVSIAFAFLTCFFLAISAILDVICLSRG